MVRAALLALLVAVCACGGASPSPARRAERERDSAAAVAALAASRFAEARTLADAALARDGSNSRAAAVRAITAYHAAGSRLRDEAVALLEAKDALTQLDREAGRALWQRFAEALGAVAGDLEIAAQDPTFSLELCLACWEHDWNHSGAIDDGDRRLFEIEYVRAQGPTESELPPGDPRRRPTFRFDTGDAEWALAMVHFQRAAAELILAYRWTDLWRGLIGDGASDGFTIKLIDAQRVRRARELILAGLDHADRCRAAYLAETDDDREWVPNPRQQSFAVPLLVDATLYQTWSDVLADARRMLRSEEGLSLRELAAMGEHDSAALMPDAFLDVGAMLRDPQDLIVSFAPLRELDREDRARAPKLIEQLLRGILGKGYSTTQKPSPLPRRLDRMKRELLAGEDTLARKLRYLLWLN